MSAHASTAKGDRPAVSEANSRHRPEVALEAALSSYTNECRLSYLEPYIFDKKLSVGTSLFNFERYMDTYDYKRTGGNVSLIKPLTDDVKGTVMYRLEEIDVTNIATDASTYIKEQSGSSLTSSMTFSLNKNTIDDVMNPTKGINSGISTEIAGGREPTTSSGLTGFYGRYFLITFWDSSFFVKGTAAIRGGGTRCRSRRNIMSAAELHPRFGYGEAGPMDENDEPIGAKNQMYFNFEWIFPSKAGRGEGASPTPVPGSITSTAADAVIGRLGIRWFFPMGPIRLEMGLTSTPKKTKEESFRFAIGTQY